MADNTATLEIQARVDQAIGQVDRLVGHLEQGVDRMEAAGDRLEFAEARRAAQEVGAELQEALGRGARAAQVLEEAGGDAGEEIDRLAEQSSRLTEVVERGEAVAERWGRTSTEAARRIDRAMAALAKSNRQVADGARLAEEAYEALGDRPVEFIGRANSETERAVILLADLQRSVDEVEEASREGLREFADRSGKARQRAAELRSVVASLGDDASPALRRELARLERQFEDTFDDGARRAARLEAEVERNEDALKRYRLEARGAAEGTVDLTEALRLRFPRASKAVLGGVTAIVAFREAYEQTRETIGFLRDELGIDVDAIVKDTLGLQKAVDALVGGSRDQREEARLLANQRRILINLGKEFVDSEDGVRQAYAEVTEEIRRQKEQLLDALRVFDELRGFEAKDAQQELEGLVAALRNLQPELRENPELLDAFRTRVERLARQFQLLREEELGPEARRRLQNLLAAVESLTRGESELAEEIRGSREVLADRTMELLRAVEVLRSSGEVTEQQAEIIRRRTRELLDGWLRLGEEVPEALQKIARDFRVVSDAEAEAIEKTQSFLERVRGSREELEERTQAILAGVEALQSQGQISEETAQRVREEVGGLVEDWETFGVQAPAALQALVAAFGPAEERVKALRAETQGLRDDIVTVVDTRPSIFKGDAESVEDLRSRVQSLRQEVEGLEGKQAGTGVLSADELGRLTQAQDELSSAEAELRRQNASTAQGLEEAADGARRFFTEAEILDRELQALGGTLEANETRFRGTDEQMSRINENLRANTDGFADLNEEVDRTGISAEFAGDKLGALDDDASALEGSLQAIGDRLRSTGGDLGVLEDGAAGAKEESGELADQLERVDEVTSKLATTPVEVAAAWEREGPRIVAALAPVVTKLGEALEACQAFRKCAE